ncbi:MAG: Amidohydrolase 3 [Gemmatimonadetes bacterium]|nr:Amidohydrolase 3 [Gemmatimonadota bacterium]
MPSEVSLAVVNARVWTGDARRPWADAVLVRGATIDTAGSSAEVKKRVDEDTRVIDAGRMTLVPGVLGRLAHEGAALEGSRASLVGAGEPADFAILDRDIARVTPASLAEARVVLVVVAGQVVHAQGDFRGAMP